MMTTAENLKRLREAKGMTQVELGRLADIPPSQISKYERQYCRIGVRNLSRLAGALGCSMQDIDERLNADANAAGDGRRIYARDDMLLYICTVWDKLPMETRIDLASAARAAVTASTATPPKPAAPAKAARAK